MNTSLNWIKAMVPGLECTDQEFRDAMTLSGTKVECFNAFDKNLDKIVVGQILSVERHPDADKLVICQVNVGSENVQRRGVMRYDVLYRGTWFFKRILPRCTRGRNIYIWR